jgi:catechol 2,3-dioxygenase-like lactoylglutathione lyase family enzyme
MAPRARRKASGPPRLFLFATTVMVSDRASSVRWYREKLGLRIVQDLGHWVTVGSRRGGLLHLCQGSEIGEGLDPGNQGITLHVRGDFEVACRALARAGVAFDQPVTRRPWGVYARIADPDGNVFTLNPDGPPEPRRPAPARARRPDRRRRPR